jgi:steroid delta-isomerase-like uncharacterized protein
MSEQDNVRIADKYIEALNAHDYERLRAYHADSFRSLQPGRPAPVDEAGYRAFLEGDWTAFPDLSFQTTQTIATGDYVVDTWIGTGTHTGPMMTPTGASVPPTGRKGTIPGVDIFEIKNGKIVRADVYFDAMTLMAQMGLVPGM